MHAVTDLLVGVDGKCEKRTFILPGKLGDVAKGRIASRRKLAHDERSARRRRSIVGRRRRKRRRRRGCGCGCGWFLSFNRIASKREVCAGAIERERLDPVDCCEFVGRGLARHQVEDAKLPLHRLFLLAQFFLLRLGVADRIRDPFRISRENRLRGERRGLRRAVGNIRDAELILTVGAVNPVHEPAAVWGEAAAQLGREGLPLPVIGGGGRLSRLGASRHR